MSFSVEDSSQDVCTSGTNTQLSGFLKSPNYPQTSPLGHHCECTLNTSPGSSIDLNVMDLQLPDTDCREGGIELQYSGQLMRLCGDKAYRRDKINTNSNTVKLVYETGHDKGDKGFWIKYRGRDN